MFGIPWWPVGKESACNERDLGSFPGLERSTGEGKGYLLQYSGLESPRTEETGGLQSMGSERVEHDWATKHSTTEVVFTWVCYCCLVAKLCLTLLQPHENSSLPGSSVHEIFQTRELECIAISFSRGSSIPWDRICVSYIVGGFFITEPPVNPTQFSSVQLSHSVVSDYDIMDCSTPGFPVHYQLPELMQTHIHWLGGAIQPSHPLPSLSPAALNPSQDQSFFQWINLLHQLTKVLKLQHQFLQWIFRIDFL